MAQWIDLNRNNSDAIAFNLLWSHTPSANGSYGRLAVKLNTGRYKKILNSLPIRLLGFSWSLTKEHCYHRVTMTVFWSVFFE